MIGMVKIDRIRVVLYYQTLTVVQSLMLKVAWIYNKSTWSGNPP